MKSSEAQAYTAGVMTIEPIDVYATCREGLDEMALEPRWQAWFEVRKHFRHGPELEAKFIEQDGYMVRDLASRQSWECLGYSVREGAQGLEYEGSIYYREPAMIAGANASNLWAEYAPPPTGNADEMSIASLVRVLEERGWQMHWSAGLNGEAVIDHMGRAVYVLPGATPLVTLNRLGHEVGHALLHHGYWEGVKWEREVEAQAFAFLLATMLGADIAHYSCVYMFGYSEGRPIEDLAFGPRIQAALLQVRQDLEQQARLEMASRQTALFADGLRKNALRR